MIYWQDKSFETHQERNEFVETCMQAVRTPTTILTSYGYLCAGCLGGGGTDSPISYWLCYDQGIDCYNCADGSSDRDEKLLKNEIIIKHQTIIFLVRKLRGLARGDLLMIIDSLGSMISTPYKTALPLLNLIINVTPGKQTKRIKDLVSTAIRLEREIKK